MAENDEGINGVVAVQGDLGTGKTVFAIQQLMVPWLRSAIKHDRPDKIYTNIEGLNVNHLAILFDFEPHEVASRVIQWDMDEEKEIIMQFHRHVEKNSLIIIDEAQIYFSNRDWNNKDVKEMTKWLGRSRHTNNPVYFLGPDVDLLDLVIRKIVMYTYHHKSYSAIGKDKSIRTSIFEKTDFSKQPMRYKKWTHDTRTYETYESTTKGAEHGEKIRVNIFADNKLILVIGLFILSLFLIARGFLSGGFSSKNKRVVTARPTVKKEIKRTDSNPKELYYKSFINQGDSTLYLLEDGRLVLLPKNSLKRAGL